VRAVSWPAACAGWYLRRVQRHDAQQLSAQLERSRDDFRTLVGHELRTPLTSIVSYTQLLLAAGQTLPADVVTMLTVINRNTHALTGLVDDLLDLAGLESGHLPIHPGPCDLATIALDAISAVGPDIAEAGLRLRQDIPASLPITADATRIAQLFTILLSNAVKYTPPDGEVTVTVDGTTITIGDRDGHSTGRARRAVPPVLPLHPHP
jgi:signal transduction histidine kinase